MSKDGNNNGPKTYTPISGDMHDADEYPTYANYVRGILVSSTQTPKKFYPCLRCGFCCRKSICAVAYYEMGKPSKRMDELECPYLEFDGSRYGCKLVDKYHDELHIGVGCCATLNTDRMRMEEKNHERLRKKTSQDHDAGREQVGCSGNGDSQEPG